MNAIAGGCLTPDFITGPLHSFCADFTIRLIELQTSTTDIVSPVIMPFLSCCHLVLPLLYVNLIKNLQLYYLIKFFTFSGI